MLRSFLSETIPQWKMPGKEELEIIESQFLSQYIGEYQDINSDNDLFTLGK